VVVQFVQFVLFQLSTTEKHPMPSNPFELAAASFFWSSAMLGEIKSLEQPLKLQFSQLLMRTASDDLASDDVITSGALLFRTSFLQMHKASFLLIPIALFLFFQNHIKIPNFFYGPVHLNNISISN
jgi:hypothetical protein